MEINQEPLLTKKGGKPDIESESDKILNRQNHLKDGKTLMDKSRLAQRLNPCMFKERG